MCGRSANNSSPMSPMTFSGYREVIRRRGRGGCRAGGTVEHVVVLLQGIRQGVAQVHADTGMSRARHERHRRVPGDSEL